MKSVTTVLYQITTDFGTNVEFETSDWDEIENWRAKNYNEHPDWRITRYQIEQVVTVRTLLS